MILILMIERKWKSKARKQGKTNEQNNKHRYFVVVAYRLKNTNRYNVHVIVVCIQLLLAATLIKSMDNTGLKEF